MTDAQRISDLEEECRKTMIEIANLRTDLENANLEHLRLVMALVKAAGGEITVRLEHLRDLPRMTLYRHDEPGTDEILYRVVETETDCSPPLSRSS